MIPDRLPTSARRHTPIKQEACKLIKKVKSRSRLKLPEALGTGLKYVSNLPREARHPGNGVKQIFSTCSSNHDDFTITFCIADTVSATSFLPGPAPFFGGFACHFGSSTLPILLDKQDCPRPDRGTLILL